MRKILAWLLRLGWFLLLVWVLVLGHRQGAIHSVILPLFVIGVVFPLQEYAAKHLPGFSDKWKFALLLLTTAFTVRTSAWPWLVHHFPATWVAAHQELKTRDILTAEKVDSCSAAAVLDALNEYRGGLDEAEGRDIRAELQILIAKKGTGTFIDADQKQLDAVFAKVKRFAEQRNELRHLMQEVCPDDGKVIHSQTQSLSGSGSSALISRVSGPPIPVSVPVDHPVSSGSRKG